MSAWTNVRGKLVEVVEKATLTYRVGPYARASLRHTPAGSISPEQLDARSFWLTTLGMRSPAHASLQVGMTRAEMLLSVVYPETSDPSVRDTAIGEDYDVIRKQLLDEATWGGVGIRTITFGEEDALPMSVDNRGSHIVAEYAFTVEYHQ